MSPQQQMALCFGGVVLALITIWACGWMLLTEWVATKLSKQRQQRAQRLLVQIDRSRSRMG